MAVDDGLVSNPNLEDDPNEFVSITTGEIYDREIFNGLKEIKQKGNAQAEEYVDKVIEKGIIPVIPRNNFYTFQNRSQAVLKKDNKSISNALTCPLALRALYILKCITITGINHERKIYMTINNEKNSIIYHDNRI